MAGIEKSQIQEMILGLDGVMLERPFGENIAVYKINSDEGKMFALLEEDTMPVRLSLRCDPGLALLLRDKYETVLPGHNLNKKHWNTIICSGQIDVVELKDLIRHSYELALNS